MIKVIGIGDNVCDKYRHLNMMFPGGQALNFAVYCRQNGNQAAYIGAFGSDEVAEHVIKTLTDMKIDISHARHYQGENGYAVIDLKDGDRVFVMSNKGGVLRVNPLELSEKDISYISQFDLVHTSNNSYIDRELPKLAKLKNLLSYDFSGTWRDVDRTREVCKWIDFGFLSCSESLNNDVRFQIQQMYNWGCKIVVATMGAHGAIVFNGQSYFTIQPEPVDAIDTLGAGDSFAAGFLMSYVENICKKNITKKDPIYEQLMKRALDNAAVLSAKTCMMQGAFGCGCRLV